MQVDAGTPEQPAEDDQVSLKVGHARCSAEVRVYRPASTSATSAVTQSIVSDTPGTL
jgi:hypothetical protein